MTQRPRLIPGCDRFLHGGDYNPDQWLHAPEIIDEDFRLMKLAGCNTFALGIFAWTSYEREEGHYDFSWLDRIMDRMAEHGHRVALATPSGAKPAWMALRYPEVRRVDRHGRRETLGGRHNHCWSSPVYREKVRAINERLAERYDAHPALGMWHISNEYSGDCFCDLCLARWHHWLQQRHGSLEALNRAWWTAFWSHTFTSFAEIDPRDFSIDGLRLDYRRFHTEQVRDFLSWEIAAVRRHSPTVPTTTNLMGAFPWVDYSRLVEVVDIVADDQYPGYSADDEDLEQSALAVSFKDELHRCLKPDRPWMLMESCPDAPQWKEPVRLKAPGLHHAEMLQAIGHGAEGTCYFQWRKGQGGCEKLHGAVVDHVGHEHTRVFRTVAELGERYSKLGAVLGSVVESDVALLYDWEVRWAFEDSSGTRSVGDAYWQTCLGHYEAFWRSGVAVDVLSSERDFSRYRLVVAPLLWMLRPGVAERLAQYVEAGGTLVSTYYLGHADEHNRCLLGGFPGAGLEQVFGLWNEETDWLGDGCTRQVATTEAAAALELEATYEASEVAAIVHARGATTLAEYRSGFYAGSPALTVKSHGQGKAYYQAAKLGPDFLRRFYRSLMKELGIRRPLGGELPPGVMLQRRRNETSEFLFLQNLTASRQSVPLPTQGYADLLTEKQVGSTLELEAWSSTVLELESTSQ